MQQSCQLTHGARLLCICCVLKRVLRALAGLGTSSAAPAHQQLRHFQVALHLHPLLGSLLLLPLLLRLLLLPGLPRQQLPHQHQQQQLRCVRYHRSWWSCPTNTSLAPALQCSEYNKHNDHNILLSGMDDEANHWVRHFDC
jgi:hypothetical protein